MEFALGILAALIGASGAFSGAWLSRRHERQLEQERWWRSRQDAAEGARAAAIGELTRHVASASHAMVWFTATAWMRAHLFTEQTIIDYDSDIRAHLTATVESLVSVASHDAEAFGDLEQLAKEVWELDGQLAGYAAGYWDDPEEARTKIGLALREAYELQRVLPHRIVSVLQPGQDGERDPITG